MGQGRGSAILGMIMFLYFMMIQFEMGTAATYTVGDSSGWTFNVAAWPKGKHFRAGDIIVFNYSPAAHNVVAVNRGGYTSCKAQKGAKVYKSGKDRIKLVKGPNFFICTFAAHCQAGMQIAINAI
ncbi:basic blue protein [Euphorbia lathyris]|uniref:basic blue protein n=1 Tax=Euphorbia lathyris TaxID=212925 RepID=UPI0033136ADC